jgi:hypothetical protein
MQSLVLPLSGSKIPELILLSTDGYANCFVTEADFVQIGPDYQHMLREQGLAQVIAQLPAILQQASQRGSGDDITLGLIQRQPSSSGLSPQANPAKTRMRSAPTLSESKTVPVPQMPLGSGLGTTKVPTPTARKPEDLREVATKTLSSSESLQSIQRQNQQQRREIKRLKFWISILLLTTLISLLLAAFSFWKLQTITRQPIQTGNPPSTNPSPSSSFPTGLPTGVPTNIPTVTPTGAPTTGQTESPQPAPTSSPTSEPIISETSPEWSLQLANQRTIPLRAKQKLVRNREQPNQILTEESLALGGTLGSIPITVRTCRNCIPLAEVKSKGNRLVFKNVSDLAWKISFPNSQNSQEVNVQAEIPLRADMQIDFGNGASATIRQTPRQPQQSRSERSPRASGNTSSPNPADLYPASQ